MTLTSERRSFEVVCDDQSVVWMIVGQIRVSKVPPVFTTAASSAN